MSRRKRTVNQKHTADKPYAHHNHTPNTQSAQRSQAFDIGIGGLNLMRIGSCLQTGVHHTTA
jgi:hypothetical protein